MIGDMDHASLTVDRVEVAYGPVKVLNGVSLAVAAGEFVALLGSSGCGKTTLLRAISGFVPVRAGSIRVAERDITRLSPERRNMAMVFQSYALWPHMTMAQNLAYGLRLRRVPRPERARRVQEIVTLLGLEGLADRPVTQLSGGQRQRVALGRALAINPRILLLDEPLSNLDARIRATMRHEIKAIQRQVGITAIHVTHDREEAMVMADRIAIMNAGEIAQIGPPEEVYNRPADPFVAAFMGADNVIGVEVARLDGALQVAAGPHNDAVRLPCGGRPGEAGVHVAGAVHGKAVAHFRSEAASLVGGDAAAERDSLVLHGRIEQSSYPGGFYRYAVDVGRQRFMVDHAERLAIGEPVGIRLPAAALHIYPDGMVQPGSARRA
jgi:putative spermidine/putrescine transport system ATP-binding protein